MSEQMNNKPPVRTGMVRIFYAFGYTFSGLKHAIKYEDAFRQEAILFTIATIAMFFIPMNNELRLMIFFSQIFVMVTELLNIGIESIVDLASPEYHELAKQAKDVASASVFLSFLVPVIIWGYVLYHVLQGYKC